MVKAPEINTNFFNVDPHSEVLKFIVVHISYFHILSNDWALYNNKAATFQCLDGLPLSCCLEPAKSSIQLEETEHMSCHLGVDLAS